MGGKEWKLRKCLKPYRKETSASSRVYQICLLTAISLPCNYSQVRALQITNISIPHSIYIV